MNLTIYRRGQLEKLAEFYGIANGGAMTKDELVAILTPMAVEEDLTDIATEPEPARGITSTDTLDEGESL